MRSLVNWALLGLVIDRPSYAYELAQRFERTYRGALTLSSVSHAYMALSTLRDRGLVEEVAGTGSERQPKPHYRATPRGVRAFREWLVGQVSYNRQRQRLLVLQLSTLARAPGMALEILDQFEETWLQYAEAASPRPPPHAGAEDGSRLTERLVSEETRLTVSAKLAWAQYAREQFTALASKRGN